MSKRSRYAHRRQANKRRFYEALQRITIEAIEAAHAMAELQQVLNGGIIRMGKWAHEQAKQAREADAGTPAQ